MTSQPLEANHTVLIDTMEMASTGEVDRGPFLRATKMMNRYVLPIIIMFGIVGNTLSLLVFLRSKLKKHSTSVYLAVLAIVDTGFLVCLFFIWLGWLGITISDTQPLCSIIVYLSYVCSFLSVWIVVSFTVERYIVVSRPLLRRQFLRKRHAKLVVSILTIVALGLYAVLFWTTGVVFYPNGNKGLRVCSTYPKYEYIVWILNHIDTVITLIVPTLVIYVMNGLIAFKIYHSRTFQERRRQTLSQPSGRLRSRECSMVDETNVRILYTSNNTNNTSFRTATIIDRSGSQNGSQYYKTTKMLLVVSSVFLCLNLPSHVIRIHLVIRQMFQPDYKPSLTAFGFQQMAELVYYVNFAINFCLYSLCGKNFRCELHALMRNITAPVCLRKKRRLSRARSDDTNRYQQSNNHMSSDGALNLITNTTVI